MTNAASLGGDEMPLTALIFDDRPNSVSSQKEILTKLGIRPVITDSIPEVQRILSSYRRIMFFADMHVPEVRDLREVNLPKVTTGRGERVGITLVRALLPAIGRKDIKSFILSSYDLSEDSSKEILKAQHAGISVEFISKKDVEQFEIKVTKAANDVITSARILDFDAAVAILAEWAEGNFSVVAKAFGYSQGDQHTWEERKESILADMTYDVADRVQLILHIKECLSTVYMDNQITKERGWLQEPDPHLPDGKSPFDCIFGGRQHELALAAGFLARLVS